MIRYAVCRNAHGTQYHLPVSHVFHRQPKQTYPLAVAGDGCYLIDANGKRYLDASSGAAVSCLGHNDAAIIDAIKIAVDKLSFAHTSFFTNQAMESLADELIAEAPVGIDRAYFCSGGSEAIEAALKLARQYFVEIGQPQRRHIIARRQSYHGNTMRAEGKYPREPLIAASHMSVAQIAYGFARC